MQLEDIEAVLVIEQQSFTMPWTDAMFRSELQNERTSHMLVARIVQAGSPIVGYVGYRVVLDEMHVILIAVAPAWRQRGIARQMICQAMDQARAAGCRRARLEVRVSTLSAYTPHSRPRVAPIPRR